MRHIAFRVAGFVIFAMVMSAGGGDSAGGLRLLSAYYMPDPEPPADSHQVEGISKPREWGCVFAPLQRLYKEHAEFGGARVSFRNGSGSALKLKRILLNGTPVETHYVDFLDGKWDDRGVVWYRARPEVLAPGECGELYIRFRKHPAGKRARMSIETDSGKVLDASFAYADVPRIALDYITTDAGRKRLYVYVRRSDESAGDLKRVELDGKPLTNVTLRGADFPGNVALAIADFDEPMEVASYHVVSATTDKGETVAAQFRVLPFFYMRHSRRFNPQTRAEVEETGMSMAPTGRRRASSIS